MEPSSPAVSPTPASMTSKRLYQTPLDMSKPEIRLLEVIEDKDAIRCKLHTVTFDSTLRFAALSYVWGDTADTKSIEIDGVQLPVSRSLSNALKHVRNYWAYEFPDRDQSEFRIWVDAVCINQADKTERTAQVKLMRAIYSSADLVLGWLGADDNEKIITAMCTITTIGNVFRRAKWDVEKLKDLKWLKRSGLVDEPACDKYWQSLNYLGGLAYWQRVWILQENILASTLFYITPNMSIEYGTLMNTCTMFNILSQTLSHERANKPDFVPTHIWYMFNPPRYTGFISLGNILRFGNASMLYSRKSKEEDLEEQRQIDIHLAQYASLLQATDPRDHVYGLLGLSSLPIKPDYTKSVTEVYTDYLFDEKLSLIDIVLRLPPPRISGDVLSLCGIRLQTLKSIGEPPEIQNLQKGSNTFDWIQDYIRRIPFYATKIPSIWALFLVVMRMHRLVIDTPTMLLLQNFIARLNLDIPESDRTQSGTPKYYQTPEIDGLSVMMCLDGGNNPQLSMCISPLLGFKELDRSSTSSGSVQQPTPHSFADHHEALEARIFEVSSRLIFTLKRNYNTRIFETDEGYLGLGPQDCRVGDVICILDGYQDLVLLRKRGEQFVYVGPCMGYGISDMYIKRRVELGEVFVEAFDII
ncbi:heterokaryon incompatibility protein-domain-containing protein [Fusarium acuminatum]|uniref:Heterokaryon incompatibility protein-domain-containing protein n=1 Tax=Fusarium acuminatum TaxID=5515 RepID=A0ABZ2X1I9_9HYPO